MSTSVSIQSAAGSDLHAVALGSAYLGATIGVLMVAPQIARTLRYRGLPGVSAASWALTALSCLTWLLYGLRANESPQIPGNILMVAGAVLIVLAVPAAVSATMRAAGLVSAAVVLAVLAVVLPVPAIGIIAFAIGLVSALPQLLSSAFGRPGESGVSVLAWLLRGASQICWLFYALTLHDVVVTVSASLILVSSWLLVAIELRRREAASGVGALGERLVENAQACV